MNPAAVGFHCPSCITSGRASTRAPRTRAGARLTSGTGVSTKIMMGTLAGLYLVNFVSQNAVLSLMVMNNNAVSAGQLWRLFTYGFTAVGLFGVLMNLLVLWIAGRAMEEVLGPGRFVALYVFAGLGGATMFFVFGPSGAVAVGANAAVMGLLAANAIVKLNGREDIRPDITLLILIVLYSLLVGARSYGWLGLVGGIAVGALTGLILTRAPRQNRTAAQVVGLLSVLLVCFGAVVAKLL